METLVGKENFRSILRKYIKKFISKSVTHEDFRELWEAEVKSLYKEEEAKNILSKFNWDEWLYKTGQPVQKFDFSNNKININKIIYRKQILR